MDTIYNSESIVYPKMEKSPSKISYSKIKNTFQDDYSFLVYLGENSEKDFEYYLMCLVYPKNAENNEDKIDKIDNIIKKLKKHFKKNKEIRSIIENFE
jgi:hypothetical protein